jgi:hypothetical protein
LEQVRQDEARRIADAEKLEHYQQDVSQTMARAEESRLKEEARIAQIAEEHKKRMEKQRSWTSSSNSNDANNSGFRSFPDPDSMPLSSSTSSARNSKEDRLKERERIRQRELDMASSGSYSPTTTSPDRCS